MFFGVILWSEAWQFHRRHMQSAHGCFFGQDTGSNSLPKLQRRCPNDATWTRRFSPCMMVNVKKNCENVLRSTLNFKDVLAPTFFSGQQIVVMKRKQPKPKWVIMENIHRHYRLTISRTGCSASPRWWWSLELLAACGNLDKFELCAYFLLCCFILVFGLFLPLKAYI